MFWVLDRWWPFPECFMEAMQKTETNLRLEQNYPNANDMIEQSTNQAVLCLSPIRLRKEVKNSSGPPETFVFTLKMATLFHLDPFLAVLRKPVLRCFHRVRL